jgi:AcrR family transcriptional regulator
MALPGTTSTEDVAMHPEREVGAENPASPARPLRADAQRNYDKLIATARDAFTEQGADTSLEGIARRAGVGIGTLYRHFPTRLALLEAVYRDDVDSLMALAKQLVETEGPWEALEHWLEAFSGYAATKRVLLSEIMDVAGREPTVLSYSRPIILAAGGLVIGNAQRAGLARADIEVSDVTRLVGGCTMMPGADAEQQHRMLRLVLDGLRASPPS